MAKNLTDKEEKYLRLYEENVYMQEKISEFSSRSNSVRLFFNLLETFG
jgi:hypothetical protein